MLGYQTQSHGSTAGLTMYGSRGYSYALPVQHQHMMKNSIDWSEAPMLTVKDLPHWATSLKKYAADGLRPIPDLPAPKSIMATAMAEPADLSRLVDIEFAAFRDEKVNHHLSYRDASDTSHLKRTMRAYRKYMNNLRSLPDDSKRLAKTAQTHRRTDSAHDFSLGFMFRKVESPEGGEIIAFCKSEMAEMTPQDMLTPLDVGHEGEPQMNRDWFALNEQCHREYCGTRKHCYFGMLATHPDHQHQGAATMLMDELTQEADRANVEIYCEATKAGRPLYEKYGFVVVKEIRFTTSAYGLDLGEECQFVMVRGALGPDGVRSPPRSWADALAESASTTV